MDENSHYVAEIRVSRVDHVPDKTDVPYGTKRPDGKTTRVVHQISSIIVKKSGLEDLRNQVMAHVNLIDDDGIDDPINNSGKPGNYR